MDSREEFPPPKKGRKRRSLSIQCSIGCRRLWPIKRKRRRRNWRRTPRERQPGRQGKGSLETSETCGVPPQLMKAGMFPLNRLWDRPWWLREARPAQRLVMGVRLLTSPQWPLGTPPSFLPQVVSDMTWHMSWERQSHGCPAWQ